MSETLREKQSRFARSFALLLQYMTLRGYEYTLGQIKRTELEARANAASGAGIAQSLHLISLAGDVNLFKDGVYLDTTEAHAPLGQFWKSLWPDCRWGGDFKPKPDGNHYSIEHEGRK
jgi:hypothetical protein